MLFKYSVTHLTTTIILSILWNGLEWSKNDGVIKSLSRIFSITYFLFNQNWIAQSLSIEKCIRFTTQMRIPWYMHFIWIVSMWAVVEIKTIVRVCKHGKKKATIIARCASILRQRFCSNFRFHEKRSLTLLLHNVNNTKTMWCILCSPLHETVVVIQTVALCRFLSGSILCCCFSSKKILIRLLVSSLLFLKEKKLNKPHLHAFKGLLTHATARCACACIKNRQWNEWKINT